MRKEKIVQIIPEVYGSSAFIATNIFALTDKGHIWYKTSKGWERENLPPELEPDEPPSEPMDPLSTGESKIGDKQFFDKLAEKLEKVNVEEAGESEGKKKTKSKK